MDISATVLAAVMNVLNVEAEKDCSDLELPAQFAMISHQSDEDYYDPSLARKMGWLTEAEIRAIQLLLPETRDTPRRWFSNGQQTEVDEFGLTVKFQCEDLF
jgi:hypothetical protein